MVMVCIAIKRVLQNGDAVSDKSGNIKVRDVYYIPQLKANLLSVSQIVRKGNSFHFDSKGIRIINNKHEGTVSAY